MTVKHAAATIERAMGGLACALAVVVLSNGPAVAQSIEDTETCYQGIMGLIEPQRVIPICTRAIESGTLSLQNLAATYVNRGTIHQYAEQHKLAVADFDLALALVRDDADTHYKRGNSYRSMGRYDRAIEDYSRTIDLDPDNARTYKDRGNLYRRLGLYHRAIRDQDQVLRIDPDNPNAYYNRGTTYAAMGQYDSAIDDYDRALGFDLELPYAQVDRGVAHARMGRYDLAVKDFEWALILMPNYSRALKAMAWLRSTATNSRYRDGPAAVRHAERAIALNDSPEFRDTLAAAYAESGRYADAAREQERAISQLQAAGRDEEVVDYQRRLDLYRRNRPYRQ